MVFCCVKILLKGLKGKKGGMKMVYNPEVTKPAFLLVFFFSFFFVSQAARRSSPKLKCL